MSFCHHKTIDKKCCICDKEFICNDKNCIYCEKKMNFISFHLMKTKENKNSFSFTNSLKKIKIEEQSKIENYEVLTQNHKLLSNQEHHEHQNIDMNDIELKGFEILTPILGNQKNKKENEFSKGFENIEKKDFEKKINTFSLEKNEVNNEEFQHEKNKEIFTILNPIDIYSQIRENKNYDNFSGGIKKNDKIKIEKNIELHENKKNTFF